jgi:spermidine synthase
MKPQSTLGTATTPDGRQLVLYERDGVYFIRVDGLELMSSRAHGSEEALARLALARTRSRSPKVLVGGLGMGFTLRAVLDAVADDAEITVAEILPAVVAWNRDHLAELAHRPLDDPRVIIEVRDVAEVLGSSRRAFDVVLLDVDNGPVAFTTSGNQRLYSRRGLERIRRALRPGGVLGVWSADPDSRFVKRLAEAGFRVDEQRVPARGAGKGPRHTLFMAELA